MFRHFDCAIARFDFTEPFFIQVLIAISDISSEISLVLLSKIIGKPVIKNNNWLGTTLLSNTSEISPDV
jgi:hypothetical protein